MAEQRARRGRLCTRCGKRRVRSLESIAKELREFQKAMPHQAPYRANPESLEDAKRRGAGDAYMLGLELALNEFHAGGLADELLGYCVYCAHGMDEERRAALKAREQSLKGGRHG